MGQGERLGRGLGRGRGANFGWSLQLGLRRFWGLLGPFPEHLGAILRGFWGVSGLIMGRLWKDFREADVLLLGLATNARLAAQACKQ